MRGFYGIGVYQPKTEVNIGTLWRSAFLYGADFMFTIGRRYRKQASDTTVAYNHVPLWEFESFEMFKKSMPKESYLICVELAEKSMALTKFTHPERAVYLLGAEDTGIPEEILKGHTVVQIPSVHSASMNVAVAGSIICYDRFCKRNIL